MKVLLVSALSLLAFPAFAQDNAGAPQRTAEPAIDVQLPLSQETRTVSTETLQGVLYDLSALRHNVQQAHWNVQGIEFYQLHEFYAELYDALFGYVDQIAERKLQLGMPADARPGAVADTSRIPAIETGFLGDEQTLRILVNQYSTMSAILYAGIDATNDDLVTQDLLIAVAHGVDKHFWQLRAHLRVDIDATGNVTNNDGTATR